jgi:hypothetical protein
MANCQPSPIATADCQENSPIAGQEKLLSLKTISRKLPTSESSPITNL